MTDAEVIEIVPGAQTVVDWFGFWPNFHDGEIISLTLHRSEPSRLDVHSFIMSSDVDNRGLYELTKHAVVSFLLIDVTNIDLQGFRDGNIVSDLILSRHNKGTRITISTSYGLEGTIDAKSVAVELKPGIPQDSQYVTHNNGAS